MTLSAELRLLGESIGDLFATHLRLVRVEFEEDVDAMGSRVGVLLLLALVTLVGYAFLCTAITIALTQYTSWIVATAVVGGANFVLGGTGLVLGVRALGRRDVLARTLTSGSHQATPSVTGIEVKQAGS